ncbi:MAG TPA: sigma-70 family RNA polymerase sigma factor [Rhodanobacteraceae bacterium]
MNAVVQNVSQDDQAAAVKQYGLWIKREALLIRASMPWADADDLIQWGTLALLEAMQRFDPARGRPLGVFARPRIRGAMLDSLRRDGNTARHVAQAPSLVAERTTGQSDTFGDPLDVIAEMADSARIASAVKTLPERQQQVLQLVYVDGCNNREVARILGVSDSYATRVRRQAIENVQRAVGCAPADSQVLEDGT